MERFRKVIIATLVTLLMASGAYLTTYGVASLIYSQSQQGTQEVRDSVIMTAPTFTLPIGYVNCTQTANATESPTLTVETFVPGLNLEIVCDNRVDLLQNYTSLSLTVYYHNGDSISTVDLLAGNTFSKYLSNADAYQFDYQFTYKPKIVSNSTIMLTVRVIQ